MKKIIVIGVTGSGKSTFATKLSSRLNFPYFSLDKLFWKANWQESTDEEFFAKIRNAISHEHWIIDGNYTRTNDITWKEADTIIWIDLPFWLTLYQNVTRSIKRALFRIEIWEGTGNRESIARMFSKESVVLWLFKTYMPHKIRNESRLNSPEYSHLTFYRLKSRREVSAFLEKILS